MNMNFPQRVGRGGCECDRVSVCLIFCWSFHHVTTEYAANGMMEKERSDGRTERIAKKIFIAWNEEENMNIVMFGVMR